MEKSIKDIQKDVCTLEDIVFETARVLEDNDRKDKALTAFNDEFAYFLWGNSEDDSGKYEDSVENNYLGSIDSDDVEMKRYFMHTFISFLVIFFRLYYDYLLEKDENGNDKTDENYNPIFTENGKIIKKMYDEYLNFEIK